VERGRLYRDNCDERGNDCCECDENYLNHADLSLVYLEIARLFSLAWARPLERVRLLS
jgi:hypothetical protein